MLLVNYPPPAPASARPGSQTTCSSMPAQASRNADMDSIAPALPHIGSKNVARIANMSSAIINFSLFILLH